MKLLTFREFLTETKWGGYVYHATYNDFDPKNIKPGSHFGTLHAAMARAYSQKEFDADPKKLKVHAFKYNPKKGSKNYKIEDSGLGHSSTYILNGLARKKIIDSSHHDMNRKDHKTHLNNILKQKNITHLTYNNKTEDPKSKSHIIYDPENLEHIHSFNAPKFIKRKLGNLDNNNDFKSAKKSLSKPFFSKSKMQRKIKID